MNSDTVTTYYTDGTVKRVATYNSKGELDGHFCLRNPRGFKVIETTYCNGLIHGEYLLFSNDEQIVQVSRLEHGKLV